MEPLTPAPSVRVDNTGLPTPVPAVEPIAWSGFRGPTRDGVIKNAHVNTHWNASPPKQLWRRLGHDDTIAYAPFPRADPALLVVDTIEYPVQVNGKLRSHVTVPADAPNGDVEAAALADEKVAAAIAGATPKKVIVVPGRMINVVV